MAITINEILHKLSDRQRLDAVTAEQTMDAIMQGTASPAQIGAVLMALRLRGETAEEISGFARSMRRHATPVVVGRRPLLDTCGTGGDGSHSFNISTVAALVAAGAGATVIKHGNRAASSKSGSADLVEALGIELDPSPELLERMVNEAGFGFLFAQAVHTAMRHAAPVRRELGIRTVFNLLGPLTNPASPEYQVIGVFAPDRLTLMAEALAHLGVDRAVVVHGAGMDEVTLAGTTRYVLVEHGRLTEGEWTPADLGLPRYAKEDVVGGDAYRNAEVCLDVLQGQASPYLDVVLANAGVALWVARLASSPAEGVRCARETVLSGRAARVLATLKALSESPRSIS